MGIGLVPLSTTDSIRTVSLHDTAIDAEGSDLTTFVADRSRLDALKLRAPPPGKPWEAAAYFDVRPLDPHEVYVAATRAAAEARAQGLSRGDEGYDLPLLRWAFRLTVVGWEGVYRAPALDKGEELPAPVPYAGHASGGRSSVDEAALRQIPGYIVEDIGGVGLLLSQLVEPEGKAYGSSQQTPERSSRSARSADPIAPAPTPTSGG